MWGRARSDLEVPGCPKLVSPQGSVQDITGALLKHSEKGSRASGGHIPHEKIVNLINDIFGAGRNQTHAPSIHQRLLFTHRLARPESIRSFANHTPDGSGQTPDPCSGSESGPGQQLLVKIQLSPSLPLGLSFPT